MCVQTVTDLAAADLTIGYTLDAAEADLRVIAVSDVPVVASALLLETGDALLLESGDTIILETSTVR